MATLVSNHMLTRIQVVEAVMRIRHDWENAALGESLLETTASVGYLLYDVSVALGLNKSELELALGDIVQEIE